LASSGIFVLDDRLLIEELLVGLPKRRRRVSLFTTIYWYYRACRAATVGAGGHLSGLFAQLATAEQERARASLLELRDDIARSEPRSIVPVMADIARRHPRLNLLNLEAAATARVVGGTVWLSEQGAAGVLSSVLDAERLPWKVITLV
jgi:hypothetical protein